MFKIFKWLIIYLIVSILLLLMPAFFITDVNLLTNFYLKYQLLYALIIAIIFIPLLIRQYKKINIKEKKLNNIFYIILIGITLSIFYNGVMFYLNKYFHFTNLYENSNNLYISLISSGIIGPIIEELLFRGIIYNNLKTRYPVMKSIIITTLVFSLLHFNIIETLYALILGFMLIYVYEKYKNIKAPIVLHITSNIISSLFVIFLLNTSFLINYILIIISIILLIFIQTKVKYDIIMNKGECL